MWAGHQGRPSSSVTVRVRGDFGDRRACGSCRWRRTHLPRTTEAAREAGARGPPRPAEAADRPALDSQSPGPRENRSPLVTSCLWASSGGPRKMPRRLPGQRPFFPVSLLATGPEARDLPRSHCPACPAPPPRRLPRGLPLSPGSVAVAQLAGTAATRHDGAASPGPLSRALWGSRARALLFRPSQSLSRWPRAASPHGAAGHRCGATLPQRDLISASHTCRRSSSRWGPIHRVQWT